MNEAATRTEHIDPALKAAGWGVVEGSRIVREYPITLGRIEGHGHRGIALIADYVLVYRNHKLAVIEAKAWGELLTEGVAQAKNYAGKLAVRYTYSTNGQGIYAIDMKNGREGDISRYPSPPELWALTFPEPNVWRDRFADVPFEDKGGFFNPEWDGEPIAPEPKPEAPPRPVPPPPNGPEREPGLRRQRIKVKLADGKARTIQHMMMTSFWHPDGTPMSAQQFLEMLFGRLPEFFQDEAELRALWSGPDTRAGLLQGLAEKGFGRDQMAEMQKIINAENSDLFDVLAHVAYALPLLTREERATQATVEIGTRFNTKQQVFLGFVLS
jgi:hypothetical protein